jgi:malate dehydrogenase
VVVVGNPANTNALIALSHAPSLPKTNFSALTRLDQNRARAQVARRAAVPVTVVRDVHIWGNHSATQYPDLDHALIDGKPAAAVAPAVADVAWVRSTFIPTVQQRGAAILAARQASSALSAAKAISDHMHDWILGSVRCPWAPALPRWVSVRARPD